MAEDKGGPLLPRREPGTKRRPGTGPLTRPVLSESDLQRIRAALDSAPARRRFGHVLRGTAAHSHAPEPPCAVARLTSLHTVSALRAGGVEPSNAIREPLMENYLHLDPYPEAEEALAALVSNSVG